MANTAITVIHRERCHPERSEGLSREQSNDLVFARNSSGPSEDCFARMNTPTEILLPLPPPLRLMLMPFAALLLLLLVVPAFCQVTFTESTLPAPPGARVVRLNPAPGDFTEPSIAVNPNDPRQLIGAYQVNASVAYSPDAGQTWTMAEGTAPADYKISGDVSVTYDNQGHAFLCYIAFDKLGTENYWAHGATRNGIFVRRSLDGGKTWDKDASTVIAHNSD